MHIYIHLSTAFGNFKGSIMVTKMRPEAVRAGAGGKKRSCSSFPELEGGLQERLEGTFYKRL